MTWSPLIDRASAERRVAGRHSGHTHDRRLPAQQFLDRGRDLGRVVDELAPVLGMGGEKREHAVERGRDRVEARDQEQEADVEDLGAAELLAVYRRVEELAQDVVAPLDFALVEHAVEVLVDRVRSRGLQFVHLVAAVRGAGDRVGPDDAVLHREEARQLVEREAEQGEEHLRREGDRELLGEVDLGAPRRIRR